MQNEVRIWLKNQPVRVKKWYMILSMEWKWMEEFQSQRSDRGSRPPRPFLWIRHWVTLFNCMINENCCSEDWGRGICPLFWSPLWGIWQLKYPSLQEFAIRGKKMDLTDALCRRSAISSSQHGQNFLPFLRSYSTTTSKLSLGLGEVSLFYNSLFYW